MTACRQGGSWGCGDKEPFGDLALDIQACSVWLASPREGIVGWVGLKKRRLTPGKMWTEEKAGSRSVRAAMNEGAQEQQGKDGCAAWG